jgi:ADP-ribose pyrophosphatase YjhB (NUDIX family)
MDNGKIMMIFGVEFGEDLTETLIREVKDEVGIDITLYVMP